MFRKKSVSSMVVAIALLVMTPIMTSGTELEQAEKERLELMELIQASKEMIRFAMYAIGLDPEYKEVDLGGRLELSILPTNFRFTVEGVELERGKPVVGFFSLMLAPFHRTISPYIGMGAEITKGVETENRKNRNRNKRHQLFAGAEIGDSFFVEVKYVNEREINTGEADIYATAGFKIPF